MRTRSKRAARTRAGQPYHQTSLIVHRMTDDGTLQQAHVRSGGRCSTQCQLQRPSEIAHASDTSRDCGTRSRIRFPITVAARG
eukprot:1508219-Rhodomonas_salina.3